MSQHLGKSRPRKRAGRKMDGGMKPCPRGPKGKKCRMRRAK